MQFHLNASCNPAVANVHAECLDIYTKQPSEYV